MRSLHRNVRVVIQAFVIAATVLNAVVPTAVRAESTVVRNGIALAQPASTSPQEANSTQANTANASAAQSDSCGLYPIALSAQALATAHEGDEIIDILQGMQPGNFGWLTWTGSQGVPTLVTSLTPPGDSGTYVNPNDASDHVVSINDWVSGKAGVSNSSAVRQALDNLKSIDIVVPVWDAATGNGSNTQYHISNFARVRLTDYQLPQDDRISVRFLGYGCEPPSTATATATDSPTPTLTLGASGTMTPSQTATLTSTPTATFTVADTATATATVTSTVTVTDTSTFTSIPTDTPTETYTPTDTATATVTSTNTVTDTATFTPSYTPTPTATATATFTSTSTVTDTATFTPSYTPTETPTSTFTSTPTSTDTFTPSPTATFPGGTQCLSWQSGSMQGWIASPWMNASAELRADSNGLYGFASSGSYDVGAYFAMPAGTYKLLFSGQHLSGIKVAQGPSAPSASTHLADAIQRGSDGSYYVSEAYLEITWSINAPIDLSSTPVFTSYCYAPFTPTPTRTPSATITASVTSTFTPSSTTTNPPTGTMTPTATNTSTITSTPSVTPTAQPTNYALRFTPANAVFFGSVANANFGGDMTIEFWVRTTSNVGGAKWYDNSQFILDKDIHGEGQPDWGVAVNQGRIAFDNGNPGGGIDQPLYSTKINDGIWHHIAIVRDVSTGGGLTILYVDGVVNASGIFSTASLSNSLNLVMGIQDSLIQGAFGFRGDLDDMRLWKVTRTQSAIQADMFTPAVGNEPGLVLYLPFNEGSGQIAGDKTSNHMDGQLGGSLNPDGGDPAWILASELYNGTPTPTPVTPTPTGPTPTASLTPTVTVTSTPTNTATITTTPTATLTLVPTIPPNSALVIPGWIGSPASESSVSGIVPITLASNITLQSGRILYWPADDRTSVTTLAENLSGAGGTTLASVDTTLLANGSYIVMLSGTDSTGAQLSSGILITVVGEYKPGRVRFTINDLKVPLTGLPIVIGRTYDSLDRSRVGDFGNGWTLAVANPRLTEDQGHNVTLTLPDGKRVNFFFKPKPSEGIFGFLLYPRYIAEPGVYGSLTSNGCGLVVVSSGQYYCFPGGAYQPSEYTYTDPYGRKFVMGADGTLRSITDLNNNVLTFAADGITSSLGSLNVPFVRDSLGRITQITDPAGEVYQYVYDSDGNLSEVHMPGVASPLAYHYDGSHFFLDAVDPRGNTLITDAYYPDGHLQNEKDALGNTWQYAYDLNSHTTTTTNPDNGTVVSTYDGYGKLISQTDPLGRTSSFGYDANHNLISRSNGAGESFTYAYDANGHPISIKNPLNVTVGTVSYNQYGGPTSIRDAAGRITSIAYDSQFMPSGASDSLGTLGSYTWDTHGNPLTFTNGENETTFYGYDAFGNLLTSTDGLGHTTTYTYDSLGHVLSVRDALGHGTTYTYDELGHVLSSTDSLNHATHYAYDSNGNLTESTDPLNRKTTYTYDAGNHLIAQTYADGSSEQFSYDFRGNLLTHTDALHHTTLYTYDRAGQLTDVTYAFGLPVQAVVHYQYDSAGRKIREVDQLGHETRYTYDAAGRLLSTTDAKNNVAANSYDVLGQLISTTDFLSHVTQFQYDARGRQTRVTYADNTSTQSSFDNAGRLISTTDQAARQTRYVYDDAGRLLQSTAAFGTSDAATTQYVYDNAGRRIEVIDPLNHATHFTFDDANRLISAQDPLGNTSSSSFDAAGQLLASTDANNHSTHYAYDLLGRLTQTTYADLSTTSQQHDALGQVIHSTDQNNKTTTYDYDALGRLLSVTDPQNEIVSYTYDRASNLLSITDANNHTTSFTYDELNRQIRKTSADSTFETTDYNAMGNPTAIHLADGNVNTFVYDAMNRLASAAYFDNSAESFSYTADGQRRSVTDARGTTNYTYDDQGRVIRIVQPGGATLSCTYDLAGNRASMSTSAGTTQYRYDDADRLAQVIAQNGTTTFSYDNLGLRTQEVLPNNITVDYNYDSLNRLTNINQHNGSSVVASYAYTLDPAGNRLSVTEADGSSIHWTYDDAYRLTGETRRGSANNIVYDASFTYDPAGNRLSQTVNAATTNYTYNSLDELLAAGSTNYQYDPRGNLIKTINSAGAVAYAYDAHDRMIGAALPDGTTTTNGYDVDGRRVSQTVSSQTTNYLWDETSPYGDVILETSSGNTTSYALAGTELLSQTRNGSSSYYLQDGQGSTRSLASSAGNITDTYSYSAFGETLNHTGTTVNSYQYSGQQFEDSSGLYSLRARYYSPGIGRFLSQDKFTVNFNNPLELNRYGYTANNPINAMDPSGLDALGEYVTPNLISINNSKAISVAGIFTLGSVARVVITLIASSVAPAILLGELVGVDDLVRELPDIKIKSLEQIMMETQWAQYQSLKPKPEQQPEAQPTVIPPAPMPTPAESKKECDPNVVAQWVPTLTTKTTPNNTAADRYEIKHTGPLNYKVSNALESAWFDGIRVQDCRGLDAKYVDDPRKSPYVAGSQVPDFIRLKIREEANDLLRRYGILLRDPVIPLVGIEVITNEPRSIPYWSELLTQNNLPRSNIIIAQ